MYKKIGLPGDSEMLEFSLPAKLLTWQVYLSPSITLRIRVLLFTVSINSPSLNHLNVLLGPPSALQFRTTDSFGLYKEVRFSI